MTLNLNTLMNKITFNMDLRSFKSFMTQTNVDRGHGRLFLAYTFVVTNFTEAPSMYDLWN